MIFTRFKNNFKIGYSALLLAVALMMVAGCGHRSPVVHKIPARKLEHVKHFTMPEPGKPITILVHGTRLPPPMLVAAPALFFGVTTPSGLHKVSEVSRIYYFSYIANGLHKVAPHDFPTENFYLFGWSGMLDGSARSLAGELLYEYIKQIRSDSRFDTTPITIITISHGANVALNIAAAAEKNNDIVTQVDRLVLLCGPVMDATHNYASSSTFKTVFNIFSTGDWIQVADPQQLQDLHMPHETFFSRRTFDTIAPNLVQAEVTFNKRKLGHLDFALPAFYEKLPMLLDMLTYQSATLESVDGVYQINITEMEKVPA